MTRKQKDPNEKLYGWFSYSQARAGGSCKYTTPDGADVVVTCVTSSPTVHGTNWKDIGCVGQVLHQVPNSHRQGPVSEEPPKKKPKPPTREELVGFAQGVVHDTDLPVGGRMVVIVTDEEGAFVGVASNTVPEDVHDMLASALAAAGKEVVGAG